ncbi:MAG: DUF1570 domain-containing protein [Gemmataceae bacterium]|nr:DUF1570 domain-containing protein [Gemmataceae bacterium]
MSLAAYVAMTLLGQLPSNLDFGKGLQHWEGTGFLIVALDAGKPETRGVSSADDKGRRKGMRRQVFRVPAKAQVLACQAFAETEHGTNDGRLDVVLADENNQVLPRKVKVGASWSSSPRILPSFIGQPYEYAWEVAGYIGKRLQIVLIDEDDRPGNYLYASGFAFPSGQDFEDGDFARFMRNLETKHQLSPMARFDSKRFAAISNARDEFAIDRLKNCEIFCDQFLEHFRSRGFVVTPPSQRLMLAIFESPEGFEAYLGQKMPSGVAGVYHPPTNRLVLYDLAENRAIAAQRNAAKKAGSRIGSTLERGRFIETLERKLSDLSKDANLSTTMHEAAHQISFNCGLLNRDGDVAVWLAEGLATYCEATDQGDWTVLGTPNPLRIADLVRARGSYLPIKDLVVNDRWRETNRVLLGYAQSWALFRMLMEERRNDLKGYLRTIYSRKAPEQRLADFHAAFGDLAPLERRHQFYIAEMIARHAPAAAR